MKLLKLILTASVFTLLMASCIKRIPIQETVDAKIIAPIQEHNVIRDTIIKEVIVEKELEDSYEILQMEEPKAKPVVQQTRTQTAQNTRTQNTRRQDDDYDPNNSGFFDQYQQNYTGDPNKGLKATTRVVSEGNSDELERQKQEIERTLDNLEQRNQQEKERQAELERQRQALNRQAAEKAKQQQKNQSRGKTLDPDYLMNNNRR